MPRAPWPISALLLLIACSSSEPEPGTLRGPCYPNGTCNAGLVCLSDICVESGIIADAGATDGSVTDDGGSPADSGVPPDAGRSDAGPGDAGGGSCPNLLPNGTLGSEVADECAAEWCCPELDRCAADPACATCAAAGLTGCGSNAHAQELELCVRMQCLPERAYYCNNPLLGSTNPDLNACATVYCCPEYDACVADTACVDCLVNQCSGNALADAFLSCRNANCTLDLCGIGVGSAARNPYECERCLEPTCCDDFVACVGGTVPPAPNDLQACVECSTIPPTAECANASPAVQQAGVAVQTCQTSNCSDRCETAGAPASVRTLGVELGAGQVRVLGEVSSAGDSFLRERGACVGPSPAPTTCYPASSFGVGSYATTVPVFATREILYARAYATTRAGRVYGEEVNYRTLFLGDQYEGGTVIYTEQNGIHGLVAASIDQGTSSQWWDSVNHGPAMATGATGTAVGTGAANTAAIVNALGAGNYAARLCADLDLDGYSDWYLPSKDELDLMYQSRAAIGNLRVAGYWSSSEVGTTAWIQNLDTGFAELVGSTNTNAVRAIRAF